MRSEESTISKTYTKGHIDDQQTDFAYWQSQPYQARLATLEQIRREYHQWRYGTQPRFQRVYTVVGVEFETCYASRVEVDIEGAKVNFIDLENLKQNKRATGRYQDLADVETLE